MESSNFGVSIKVKYYAKRGFCNDIVIRHEFIIFEALLVLVVQKDQIIRQSCFIRCSMMLRKKVCKKGRTLVI